jgi:hypothetical protein
VVAYVYRLGEMDPGRAQQVDTISKKRDSSNTASLRRPVGCGVVPLSDFITNAEDDTDCEFEMPLYRTDDDNFYSLHMFIIEDISGRFKLYVSVRHWPLVDVACVCACRRVRARARAGVCVCARARVCVCVCVYACVHA